MRPLLILIFVVTLTLVVGCGSDAPVASAEFEAAIAELEDLQERMKSLDPSASIDTTLADLRVLQNGFRELAREANGHDVSTRSPEAAGWFALYQLASFSDSAVGQFRDALTSNDPYAEVTLELNDSQGRLYTDALNQALSRLRRR